MTKHVVPECRLYRMLWLPELGYVVYRHCFDVSKCSLLEGAREHRQASFICEDAAIQYCDFRNAMIDKNGTDEIPQQRHVWQPGDHFSMQQSAAKYTGFGRRRPRYTTCFVINEDGLPEWTEGGVKPRPETIKRAIRYVLTGDGD